MTISDETEEERFAAEVWGIMLKTYMAWQTATEEARLAGEDPPDDTPFKADGYDSVLVLMQTKYGLDISAG